MSEVSKLLGMRHNFSSSYHPESQGLVERFNKTLCHLLKSYVSSNQKDWCSYLDLVLFAYRTSPQSSSRITPFELVHGRLARLPVHLICPDDSVPTESTSLFLDNLKAKLAVTFDTTKSCLAEAAQAQKQSFDKRAN
jgi:hypothetical protein